MVKNESFGKVSGFIDKDTEIVGDIRFKDSFRIDGKFKGKILSGSSLIIGETGATESRTICLHLYQDYFQPRCGLCERL